MAKIKFIEAYVFDTAKNSYQISLASGLISRCRLTLFEFIYLHQDKPGFGGAIADCDMAAAAHGDSGRGYRARFAQLRRMDVIEIVGFKRHAIKQSNGKVIYRWQNAYRTTGRPAKKYVAPPSYKKVMVKVVADLTRIVARASAEAKKKGLKAAGLFGAIQAIAKAGGDRIAEDD